MMKQRIIVKMLLTTSLTFTEVAKATGVSVTTVARYRRLLDKGRYQWDDLKDLGDSDFYAVFNKTSREYAKRRPPDFAKIRDELDAPGITLRLLWESYFEEDPDNSLSYSQFTHNYREYTNNIDKMMRQPHIAGERCFVDFSGKRPSYISPETGGKVDVELFVGVLGCSNFIFAKASPDQRLPNWIDLHQSMFAKFGGVPKITVPDNLRSAVTRAGPNSEVNRTYSDMAEHYGTTILPARPYKPRDKAKVENAVLIVQRWILAKLRGMQFFSLIELNETIDRLCDELNERPFKKLPGCRRSRYDELERPHMLPLPVNPYEYAEWTGSVRVDSGYHISIDGHWYSVPHQLVGQKVRARYTVRAVEIFHDHKRVAVHPRSNEVNGLTTSDQHRTDAHRLYANRSPDSQLEWAEKQGQAILQFVMAQFERASVALAVNACEGLRRLVRQYGLEEVEAAATRAVEIKSVTLTSVRSLLTSGRHKRAKEDSVEGGLPIHQNVRGAGYYAAKEEPSC